MPIASLLPCRLIVDGPAAGAWQMAVDEVLLESAAGEGRPALRFYQWSEPTLSLGYFQNYRQRELHKASRDCPLVRRQTGGGAILHDRELTYSLALPLAHPLVADASRLYDAAHESLVHVLGKQGVPATVLRGVLAVDPNAEPFLCFQRRASGDVVLDGHKVCGSAQRRRRGAILQHGSLLLATSDQAPELSGIRELTGKRLGSGPLADAWGRQLAARLGLSLEAGGLTADELSAVRTLTLEKYSGEAWNHRR